MSESKDLAVLPNQQVIEKLASTYSEAEQKQISRDMFLVTQVKKIACKDEAGKNTKRPFTPFEALSYIIVCRALGFEPMLDHIIPLEDKFYITLD